MQFYVLIPARFDSQRLPGKVLAEIEGRPMVVHVAELAQRSGAMGVYVATDSDKVAQACRAAGVDVVMTSSEHQTGSDRLAEAARKLQLHPDAMVINIQADEPLLPASLVRRVAHALEYAPDAPVASVAVPATDAEIDDPSAVKVVVDARNYALYFSRATIPHCRDAGGASPAYWRHVGIYGYRASFLTRWNELEPSPAEESERLEQLRALHHGARIKMVMLDQPIPGGVDTAEDLVRVRAEMADREQATRVLFVCMANICRSPTAEAIARRLIRARGLEDRIEVDSAATHDMRRGESPDPRSIEAAERRGISLSGIVSRPVDHDDFYHFDHILVMDERNYQNLMERRPHDARAKVEKIMRYSNLGVTDDVPDPYGAGGRHAFEQVLNLLSNAVGNFIDQISAEQQAERETAQ